MVFVILKPCIASLEVDTTSMEVSTFLFSGLPSLADLPIVTMAGKSIRKMERQYSCGTSMDLVEWNRDKVVLLSFE